MANTAKLPSPEEFRASLQKVVDYLFSDELEDYLNAMPQDHIFLHVQPLRNWLQADRDVLANRAELRLCCALAKVADAIEEADAADANGEDWPNAYEDARQAAKALREIRRTLRDILNVAAEPETVAS